MQPGVFRMGRLRILSKIWFLGFLLRPSSAHAAGLVLSIDPVTGPSSGQGTFEVLLTNTTPAGGQSFDVASLSFALMLPTAAGVQFTDATTATTTAAYLFEGT